MGAADKALPTQRPRRAAIHLSHDRLDAVGLALNRAGAPGLGEADDGVTVAGQARGEAADSGIQRGGRSIQASRYCPVPWWRTSAVVVGELVAGSHDPGGDPPGRRHPDGGRRCGSGAVDGEAVPQYPQAAVIAAVSSP